MPKLPTKRSSYRLPLSTLRRIDAMRGTSTRTESVCECLKTLVHNIQFDMFESDFLSSLLADRRTHTDRQTVYMRLPIILTDYLAMNNLNITACIVAAVNLYADKNTQS